MNNLQRCLHFQQRNLSALSRGIVFAASVIVLSKFATAQQSNANIVGVIEAVTNGKVASPYSTFISRFEESGDLRINLLNTIAFDRQLRFFESETIFKELALSLDQQEDFKSTVKDWRKELDECKKNYEQNSGESAAEQKNAFATFEQELEDIEKSHLDRLKKVLLPFQYEAIKQMQLRFLIRVEGLDALLKSEPVMEYLETNKAEIQKGKNAKQPIRMEAIRKLAEARQEVVNELLKPLSDEQRDELFKKWKFLKDDKRPGFEQLRFHLMLFEDPHTFEEDEPPLLKFFKFPDFKMDVAGKFQPTLMEKRLDESGLARLRMRFLWSLSKLPEFAEFWELNEFQLVRLREIIKVWRNEEMRLSTESLNFKGDTHKEWDEFRQDNHRRMMAAADAASDDVKKLFSEKQWEAIDALAEKRLQLKRGFVVDMMEGPLSESLQLDDTAKRDLKRNVKKALQQLDEKAIDIEEYTLTKLVEALSDSTQAKFKKLIGPQMEHSAGSVEGLLMHVY